MMDKGKDPKRMLARALYHLQSILRMHGKTLEDINLPSVIQVALEKHFLQIESKHLGSTKELDNDGGFVVSQREAEGISESLQEQLNPDQKKASLSATRS